MRLFLLLCALGAAHALPQKHIIVCDAGSTGTRIYVYTRKADGITLTGTSLQKVKPGLSTFGAKPKEATAYLMPLFEDAMKHLDASVHSATEVHIMATAGMRLIPESQQDAVWDAVYAGLSSAPKSAFPFIIRRSHLATIPGETEGYFAALASNQLSGLIDAAARPTTCGPPAPTDPSDQLVGALDLGGSSTQIVFPVAGAGCAAQTVALRGSNVPPPQEQPLRKSDFWVYSYLGFGAEKASEKAWAHIAMTSNSDPCTNPGFPRSVMTPQGAIALPGAGNGNACRSILSDVLFGSNARACDAIPGGAACAVQGVSVPDRAQNVHFLAMSVYYYAVDCIRALLAASTAEAQDPQAPSMQWPSPSVAEMEAVTDYYCAIPWADGKRVWVKEDGSTVHPFTDADSLPDVCLRANYIIVLLRQVYGIPRAARAITIIQEVNGEEVEWTRGAALSILSGTHGEAVDTNYSMLNTDFIFRAHTMLGFLLFVIVGVGLAHYCRRKRAWNANGAVLSKGNL